MNLLLLIQFLLVLSIVGCQYFLWRRQKGLNSTEKHNTSGTNMFPIQAGESIRSAYGLLFTVFSVGESGVVIQNCKWKDKDDHLWTGDDSWQFGWETVAKLFPCKAEEIRIFLESRKELAETGPPILQEHLELTH